MTIWYEDPGAVVLFNNGKYLEVVGDYDPVQNAVLVRELAAVVRYNGRYTDHEAMDFATNSNRAISVIEFNRDHVDPCRETGGARGERLAEFLSRPYWLSMTVVATVMPLPDFREALARERATPLRCYHPETGAEIPAPDPKEVLPL